MLVNPYAFGAAVTTARRYTRVRITAPIDGGGTISLSQLACYTSVGGSDILAGSGATITVSNGGTASNLTDGNDSTFCASTAPGTQDIVIDWGAGNGQDICEIGIKGRNDGVFGQTPFAGSVAYSSDNSTYTTDWSWPSLILEQFTSGATLPLQRIRRTSLFPGGTNRRLWGIKWNTSSANPPELAQLEMRDSIGGANRCTGGKAVSYALFNSGFSPALAFDGTSSQWAATSIARSYLGYDHLDGNEKAKPAQIMIKASGIPSRAPTDFDLWYQDGVGGAITVQENFTTPATWTSGEVRTFTVT